MNRVRTAWGALMGRHPIASHRVGAIRRAVRSATDVINSVLGFSDADATATLLRRGDYPKLRAQARELAEATPLMKRYAQAYHENAWGPSGITLQALPPLTRGAEVNTSLATQCELVYYRWCETADVSGSTFDDTMEWFDTRFSTDGEAAIEIVFDPSMYLGFGVRRIDADLINWQKTQARKDGRRAIDRGVEVNRNGKPVAYWLLSHRPSEAPLYGPVMERRVPADLIMIEVHGDGVRGVTPLAPVMLRADMLNKMQEAVVAAHRAAACKMGFIETAIDGDTLEADAGQNYVSMDAASGVIEQLPAGAKFTSWEPGTPGAQYREIYITIVQEIAAGLPGGITYANLTGDMSQANYGSLRQGELTARSAWRVVHRRRGARVLRALYQRAMRSAVIAREITTTLPIELLSLASWHGRPWPWIDPLKDAQAIRELLALNLTSRTRELNALGVTASELFAELAEEVATLESLNLPTVVTTAQAHVASAEVAAASRPRLTA